MVRHHPAGALETPPPLQVGCTWEDVPGGTRMVLRNRGEPSGFGSLAAPLMGRAMRRADEKDLAGLKELLESGPH